MSNPFKNSRILQSRAHRIIPGGCHTYAKGDDQFPLDSPGFISRGKGCHVWDVDGNEFIEYGMGCRAVTLGHAFDPIVNAVSAELQNGTNFTRPGALEVECAEKLLEVLPFAEMCKFSKNGSDVTTAAIKLARAATGRKQIALCQDHPFFSTDDWFIGTTAINSGIPEEVSGMSHGFRYGDPDHLKYVLKEHPGQFAAVIMEPAKYTDPPGNYLHEIKRICEQEGCLFILDEMITGFRFANGGGQECYDVEPDLSTFGKALANGFALSALAGKRKYMELGGLYHDRERVFLLSTTHGAESHSLAAGIATIEFYQTHPVVETLERQGGKLKVALKNLISEMQLDGFVDVIGKPCNLVFSTRNEDHQPCQRFRSLLMQELIRHGVLGPSLVISYSHSDDDIEKTVFAFREAFAVYRTALSSKVEEVLNGRPSDIVYRNYNGVNYQVEPDFSSIPIQ